LPEPIPTAEVPQERFESLVDSLRAGAEHVVLPDAKSPLFKAFKKTVFLRQCKKLSVEQAMAQFEDVFAAGLDNADVQIALGDVRTVAEQIGNDATPGIVEEALADARLFRSWIHDVIKAIASKHFADVGSRGIITVALDVPHIDLPSERGDEALLVINVPDVWDEDGELYRTHTFVQQISWLGRHVTKAAWVEYVMGLMRIICALRI